MVGSGSIKVFAAEATGPLRTKMHPRLSTMAKWIWSIYLGLTVACILSFYFCGMSWFDSINYAMTTTATGGFATHNDSAEFFQSPTIEYFAILFQFLAGINFMMLYISIFKLRMSVLLKILSGKSIALGIVPGGVIYYDDRTFQRRCSHVASYHMGDSGLPDVHRSLFRFHYRRFQMYSWRDGLQGIAQ